MYSCKIVLDSIAPSGGRLTTFEVTFPRIVLAEFNTHRMLSRNSASSRAIPVKDMLDKVQNDPFFPIYWGKNQKGMQAQQELTGTAKRRAELIWRNTIRTVVDAVKDFTNVDLHKQIANRWLEPALWHTTIVTATEYINWFNLRDNKQAQPEIKEIAHMMKEMYFKSNPRELDVGEWHLPYVTGNDEINLLAENYNYSDLRDISVGRCGRVSYLTHDGLRNPKADIEMTREKLIPSGHMSPTEHVAESLDKIGWEYQCKEMFNDWMVNRIPIGNFWGWKQYRKTLRNEHCFPEPK